MDVNETTMFKMLKPLLNEGEKSLCPVFAMVNKEVKRMTHKTSEYAFITITSKARLVLYRFDNSVSRSESYMLSTIIFGEAHELKATGIYAYELSFLDDNGKQQDLNISVDPQPKGRAEELPNQNKYSKKMFDILRKILPEEV